MGSSLLLAGIAIALVSLIPARRLRAAGWQRETVLLYYLLLCVLGFLAVELRGGLRILLPLLLISYVAPFVTVRAGLDRLLGRDRRPVVHPAPIRRVGPGDDRSTRADGDPPSTPGETGGESDS